MWCSPLQYFAQQILLMNPVAVSLGLGLVCAFVCKAARPYRFLGISYLVSFAVITALHGKNYYLAPIYPMLVAPGGGVHR